MHTEKKSFEFFSSNRRFWLKFSNPVYKRISLSFTNGLLYIPPKKKPIFRLHLRFFFLCTIRSKTSEREKRGCNVSA